MDQAGHPVEIYSQNEDGSYALNEENIRKILMQDDIKDLPVMVLSVAGAMREGKSFILNFFIKYLESGKSETWLENKAENLEGFSWRGGCKSETLGILMWSKAFHGHTREGKVAILLMDTQGLFDNESSTKVDNMIMSMSLLLSSLQVYNVMSMLKVDSLKNFKAFIEFAKLTKVQNSHGKIFQTLLFLVRDWTDEQSHPLGKSGGSEYVHAQITSSVIVADEEDSNLDGLKEIFENIAGFLLPSPGGKVTKSRKNAEPFRGALKDIDPDFVGKLPEFVETLFSPDNIVVKTLNGQVLHSSELLTYAIEMNRMLSGGELPEPLDFLSANLEAWNAIMQQRTLDYFHAEMTKVLCDTAGSDIEDFKEMSNQVFENTMSKYGFSPRFGNVSDMELQHRAEKTKQTLLAKHAEFEDRFKLRLEKLKERYVTFIHREMVNAEVVLTKEFDKVISQEKEIVDACNNHREKIESQLRREFKHPALNAFYQESVEEDMTKLLNQLLLENRRMEETIRLQLNTALDDSLQKARKLVATELEGKILSSSEMENCKRNISMHIKSQWSEGIKGPLSVMEECVARLDAGLGKVFKEFDSANQRNKKSYKQHASVFAKEMKNFYQSKMNNMVACRSWDEENLSLFHSRCLADAQARLYGKDFNDHLMELCEDALHEEIVQEYAEFKIKNEECMKRFEDRCELAKRECITFGEKIIKTKFGNEYTQPIRLKQIYTETQDEVLTKFDCAVRCGAQSIKERVRKSLEKEMGKLRKLAQDINENNKGSMDCNARILLDKARSRYREEMTKFGADKPYVWTELRNHHDKSCAKIRNLLTTWTTTTCVKKLCEERVEKVLSDEFENVEVQMRQTEKEKDYARNKDMENWWNLNRECVREYKKTMQRLSHLEFERRSELALEAACTVWNEKKLLVHGDNPLTDRFETLLQALMQVRYDVEVEETRKQQRMDDAVRKLVKFYTDKMESETIERSWSECELMQRHEKSTNAMIEQMHRMNLSESEDEVLASVLNRLDHEKKSFDVINDIKNDDFEKLCLDRVLELVHKYNCDMKKTNVTPGERQRAKRSALKDFERLLSGGRPEMIERYKLILEEKLELNE